MEELKIKIKGLWVIIVLYLSYTIQAQDSTIYTLQKCIDIALQNNQAVTMAGLQVQSSSSTLQQARASALPYVSGYANQGISTGKSINPYTNAFINQEVNTGQYGINAGLTLFNGFNTINTMQQSAFNHKANKMDYEQSKMDISIQVTLAYLLILSNEELVNQASSQMAATQTQLDRLNVLQQNNAVSPSVLYDTRGQLANDKLNLINTKAALATAKLSLAQLLNLSFLPTTKFEKIATDLKITQPLTKEDLYSTIQNTIPGVKSSNYRKISALKGLHAARGAMLPTLTLNGSLASNYSSAALLQRVSRVYNVASNDYVYVGGNPSPVYATQYEYQNEKIAFNNQIKNNFNTYVGLSLQVPLFNALKNKTQADLAKIKYKQFEVQQKSTEIRYKTVIEQTGNDLANAFERYTIVKEQVGDYAESFRIATTKFEKGAITTFEYINSKTNYEKAKANLISLQYDYIFRGKVLDFYRKGS